MVILKSEEQYVELATRDLETFFELYQIEHPYKKKEEEIFKLYYEDSYVFNYYIPISCITYAKKSSKVLLNTLKKEGIGIYFLDWFDKEAFNDEVLRYIEENDLIDKFFNKNKKFICEISELAILKIKKNRDFIFGLFINCIDEMVISYIRSINFGGEEIKEYIRKNNKVPNILYHQQIILDFINEGEIDNINILLENDIELSDENITLLINEIKRLNHQCLNITNKYLLKNDFFLSQLVSRLNIKNPYDLKLIHLISNLGRCLEKLGKIFSRNEIEIIKREVIENDYYINMIGILNNINLNKLKLIYDKLYRKEIKCNDNFSFFYFIKIMNYFSNNLLLVSELNKNEITDEIINNLALAININDIVNYYQLEHYINIYKNNIKNSNLSYEDKIYSLLINSRRGKSVIPNIDIIDSFKEDILNIPQLTFLQLEFDLDSIEYKLLESYIELSKLLHNISNLSDEELREKYLELHKCFIPNAIYDMNMIRENILRLYARIYYEKSTSLDKLKKNGKCIKLDDRKIYDITGEEFTLFIHDDEFHHIDDEETGDYYDVSNEVKYIYICCEIASELNYSKVTDRKFMKYSFENPTSLIAFGNRDVYIKHTKKPLIEARYRFVNYYDMGIFYDCTHASTEFDFLRFDDNNKKLINGFYVVKDLEAASLYARDKSCCVLLLDEKKHTELLMLKMKTMIENISNLNYKELYYLIILLSKFMYLDCYIEQIKEVINKYNEKEQLVLNDILNRCIVYVDELVKVKTI